MFYTSIMSIVEVRLKGKKADHRNTSWSVLIIVQAQYDLGWNLNSDCMWEGRGIGDQPLSDQLNLKIRKRKEY